MGKRRTKELGVLKRGHLQERYESLCKKLDRYRIEEELHEARKSVLDFVTGLRFSTLIIYEMRNILKNTNLFVNWGTILDDEGKKCSPECDIIVYKNGSEFAWNGDIVDRIGGRVMDFHFVNKQNVKLVVSCKAYEVTQIDQNMKSDIVKLDDYVENVWLFTECCNTDKIDKLRHEACAAGYKNFYYLYSIKQGEVGNDFDEGVWLDFIESLLSLVAG